MPRQVAQSNAIARYVARKGHLQGDNDKDFAMSEMLIEEASDIYGVLVKAHYATGDRAANWKKALSEDIPAHLANLEKLLHGPQFCSKVLAGDLAIYSVRPDILLLVADSSDHVHHPQEPRPQVRRAVP